MVLPQYTFAALAIGAIAAIAVTLYATLNGNPQNRYRNRPVTNGNNSGRQTRQKQCEICHKKGEMVTLPCRHTYHKCCFMNLHGEDVGPQVPFTCVVCWEQLKKEDRSEIESKRDTECSICLEDIVSDAIALECGHEFHNKCAHALIQHQERKCPNCRLPLAARDLRQIVSYSVR